MPRINSNEIVTTTNTAGWLIMPLMVWPFERITGWRGEAMSGGGGWMPRLSSSATTDGDRRGPDCVFQDEIPADHPANELAHGFARVGVGAAGSRDQRGELAIAE